MDLKTSLVIGAAAIAAIAIAFGLGCAIGIVLPTMLLDGETLNGSHSATTVSA